MRIDALTVALRPRSGWEAIELGTALTRRHARAVWAPWLVLTLPVFVLFNAIAWSLDALWAGGVAMWWLKPLFARIPLYVLSRAVFGEVPRLRATLRDAFRGAGGAMLGYLTWRRWSPARALLMPVDVLEGATTARTKERRRVIAGNSYGTMALTWLVLFHFEGVIALGTGLLVFMFIPEDLAGEALQQAWTMLTESPAWFLLVQNALAWIAASVIEPFHVGAGFGLYLNRRTELEGWDIELAFRRLRERLQAAATAIVLVACLSMPMARAQTAPVRENPEPALRRALGDAYVAPNSFDRAAKKAFDDPRVMPRRDITVWKPKKAPKPDERSAMPAWMRGLSSLFGTLGEIFVWVLVAVGVGLLAWTSKYWWPWLRGMTGAVPVKPSAAVERELVELPPLPDDVPAEARRLWNAGRVRDALALVYRAGVESMSERIGRTLPPGSTEAQCLTASGALDAPQRDAFARSVRLWQQMAYADRAPESDAFEAMLAEMSSRFGWAR